MILIVFILSILGFAGSYIFIQKKTIRILCFFFSLVIMIVCETSIILLDKIHLGMETKEETKVDNLYSIDENSNKLYYDSETIIKTYLYKVSRDGKTITTDPSDRVSIVLNQDKALVSAKNRNTYYQNDFYKLMFSLIRKDGETLNSNILFKLPSEWKVVEKVTKP